MDATALNTSDTPLRRSDLDPDPYVQFATWFDAFAAVTPEPEAMALATVDADGTPSVRMVLLRGVGDGGFTFYTNDAGRKGRALAANKVAALLLFSPVLGRQIRIEGAVERVDGPTADAYFASRRRGHQLGAWASNQSEVVKDRQTLEAEVARRSESFGEGPIPRPPHWGGYRVMPRQFEFWQNRTDRLHDRFTYERSASGWTIERRQP